MLIFFGLLVGFISSFFGVGGGMVLIPLLLFSNFLMKEAVNIAIIQMFFSSTYGTFLNYQIYKKELKYGLIVGVGGFIGGFLSEFFIQQVSDIFLQYLFLLIVLFAIIKIFITPANSDLPNQIPSKIALLLLGIIVGFIAISIGVGGAVMLTPILFSFFRFDLKNTSAISLFFVLFSSFAGIISHTFTIIEIEDGLIIGISSLVGVYFGIKAKEKIKLHSYKTFFLIMYLSIFFSVLYDTIY